MALAFVLALTAGARAHDVYTGLKNPLTGASCCNDNDCHRVQFDDVAGGVIFHLEAHDVFVPEKRVSRRILDPAQPEMGHWCGAIDPWFGPETYCAFAPPPLM